MSFSDIKINPSESKTFPLNKRFLDNAVIYTAELRLTVDKRSQIKYFLSSKESGNTFLEKLTKTLEVFEYTHLLTPWVGPVKGIGFYPTIEGYPSQGKNNVFFFNHYFEGERIVGSPDKGFMRPYSLDYQNPIESTEMIAQTERKVSSLTELRISAELIMKFHPRYGVTEPYIVNFSGIKNPEKKEVRVSLIKYLSLFVYFKRVK
jgi:hypothetical protein